jgi:predicted HicB family RNase H-like nuclease
MWDSPMMNHKGYIGQMHVDLDTGLIRGEVINTRDVITFHGKTVDEAKQAFRDSVDDYLAFCASLGNKPEKPYSGNLTLRVSPRLHQRLHMLASARGESLNQFIKRRLAAVARKGSTSEESLIPTGGHVVIETSTPSTGPHAPSPSPGAAPGAKRSKRRKVKHPAT